MDDSMSSLKFYNWLLLCLFLLIVGAELLVCHLTHSLIILTDTYINLYHILQLSTALLYLSKKTKQKQIEQAQATSTCKTKSIGSTKNVEILGRTSTFELARLPIIGSFVDGLFLNGLLLSIAIEGIQTCFHVGHLSGHETKSIVESHELTYPLILASLALATALLQYCAKLVRDKHANLPLIEKFNAHHDDTDDSECSLKKLSPSKDSSVDFRLKQLSSASTLPLTIDTATTMTQTKIVDAKQSKKQQTEVTLKSLKQYQGQLQVTTGGDSNNKMIEFRQSQASDFGNNEAFGLNSFFVYFSSPLALVICCLIVCFVRDELFTEISDASLAVTVGILTIVGLYPSLKLAARVLLQSVPCQVDLDALKANILRDHPAAVKNVHSLHIWDLSANGRATVATCHLLVNSHSVRSTKDLNELLEKTRRIFQRHSVDRVTIQAEFDVKFTRQILEPKLTSNETIDTYKTSTSTIVSSSSSSSTLSPCASSNASAATKSQHSVCELNPNPGVDENCNSKKPITAKTTTTVIDIPLNSACGDCQLACCSLSDLSNLTQEEGHHHHHHHH